MIEFCKRHIGICVAAGVTIVILWTMLLPGYILSLDMVFTPSYYISHSAGTFYNSLPIDLLLKFLYLFLPGWIVQKIVLVTMFFLLSFLSFKYLPVPQRFATKLFSSLLYTANPFVYDRMLAGQWTHIFAYALFPWFFSTLFTFVKYPTVKKAILSAFIVSIIGIFSLQLFVMAILAAGLWILLQLVRLIKEKRGATIKIHSKLFIVTLICLFIGTSFWTLPALIHHTAPEAAFGQAHFETFAPAAHGAVPVLLNLLTLNGFWGERYAFANYFAWPQAEGLHGIGMFFWLAWICIIILFCIGIYQLFRKQKKDIHITINNTKIVAIFLCILATAAFIFSTGAANTPFLYINLWLYNHAPFWQGFRDSQKFIALVAFVFAIGAGFGFHTLITKLEKRKLLYQDYIVALLFLIPIFFGAYVWGGFAKQLRPVFYPDTWAVAKTILAQDKNAKALILPWEGYFSLAFDNKLIVANPASQFFGPQAVASQNFRLGGIYDQVANTDYSDIDLAIQENNLKTDDTMAEFLLAHGIQYVIYLEDIKNIDIFSYTFLHNKHFSPLINKNDVIVYKID